MSAWMHVAGWVLVHFIWQGALLAVVSAMALRACRRRSASLRYGIACATLAAMLAAVAATAALIGRGEVHHAKPLQVQVLVSREAVSDAALPIQLDTRPLSMPQTFSRARVEALFPWVVSIWLAGVILLLSRTAAGWWRVRRLHQRALQDGVFRVATLGHAAGRPTRARSTRSHRRAPGHRRAVCRRMPAPDRRVADRGDRPAQHGAGRGHPGARACARAPARLPGEPAPDAGRDAVVLPPGGLVALRPDSRRARALLRRCGG